jgi:hypothetical protein
MTPDELKELMTTLDHSWNNPGGDTFTARHAENTAVYWPRQPEPTRGMHDHRAESEAIFKSFENHIDTSAHTRSSSPRATGPARSPAGPAPRSAS